MTTINAAVRRILPAVETAAPVAPIRFEPLIEIAAPRKRKRKQRVRDDDPCWPGYHMVGMKDKDGREVPNCVPDNPREHAAEDSHKPPKSVATAARKGLELRKKFKRGGTEIGVARARDLSSGRGVSLKTIRRMVSYFARHAVDAKADGWGSTSNPSAGYVAWLLWGGNAGKAWAASVAKKAEKK